MVRVRLFALFAIVASLAVLLPSAAAAQPTARPAGDERQAFLDLVIPPVFAFGDVGGASAQGDYDQDGDVDGSDFLVWRSTFEEQAPPRVLVPGDTVGSGDRVVVGPGGWAVVRFFDGSELELEPGADVIFGRLGPGRDGGGMAHLGLVSGDITYRGLPPDEEERAEDVLPPFEFSVTLEVLLLTGISFEEVHLRAAQGSERHPGGLNEVSLTSGEGQVQIGEHTTRLGQMERIRALLGQEGQVDPLVQDPPFVDEDGYTTYVYRLMEIARWAVLRDMLGAHQDLFEQPLDPLAHTAFIRSHNGKGGFSGDCSDAAQCIFALHGEGEGLFGDRRFLGLLHATLLLLPNGDQAGLDPESGLALIQGQPGMPGYTGLIFHLFADQGGLVRTGLDPDIWVGEGTWEVEGVIVSADGLCFERPTGTGRFQTRFGGWRMMDPLTRAESLVMAKLQIVLSHEGTVTWTKSCRGD